MDVEAEVNCDLAGEETIGSGFMGTAWGKESLRKKSHNNLFVSSRRFFFVHRLRSADLCCCY